MKSTIKEEELCVDAGLSLLTFAGKENIKEHLLQLL
jgi:hypothetical protein